MIELGLKENDTQKTWYKNIPNGFNIITYWDSDRHGLVIIKDKDEIKRILEDTTNTIFAFNNYKKFNEWSHNE